VIAKIVDVAGRFFALRNEARAASILAIEPRRDARGRGHMPSFPLREWLVWGGFQLLLLAIAYGFIGLVWLACWVLS
jgi:hypothetical protein